MSLAEPLRLCPHRRTLLYLGRDGSPFCLCDLRPDPADEHLDERLRTAREHWDALGRAKRVSSKGDGRE